MADKASLIDGSEPPPAVVPKSPAESYVTLTGRPGEVAALAVFVVLLAYASGVPLVIVSVLKQCDALPSLDDKLFWSLLFPMQMGQFKENSDHTASGIDLNAPKYLLLAVPFFLLSMAWEWFMLFCVVEHPPRHTPRLNDTLISLSLGVLSQVVTVLVFLLWVKPMYKALHAHIGIIDPSPESAVAWWAALVMYDFCYYWWHRTSHYVSWLWTDHVVHHSSEGTQRCRARYVLLFKWTGMHLCVCVCSYVPALTMCIQSIISQQRSGSHSMHLRLQVMLAILVRST